MKKDILKFDAQFMTSEDLQKIKRDNSTMPFEVVDDSLEDKQQFTIEVEYTDALDLARFVSYFTLLVCEYHYHYYDDPMDCIYLNLD